MISTNVVNVFDVIVDPRCKGKQFLSGHALQEDLTDGSVGSLGGDFLTRGLRDYFLTDTVLDKDWFGEAVIEDDLPVGADFFLDGCDNGFPFYTLRELDAMAHDLVNGMYGCAYEVLDPD